MAVSLSDLNHTVADGPSVSVHSCHTMTCFKSLSTATIVPQNRSNMRLLTRGFRSVSVARDDWRKCQELVVLTCIAAQVMKDCYDKCGRASSAHGIASSTLVSGLKAYQLRKYRLALTPRTTMYRIDGAEQRSCSHQVLQFLRTQCAPPTTAFQLPCCSCPFHGLLLQLSSCFSFLLRPLQLLLNGTFWRLRS